MPKKLDCEALYKAQRQACANSVALHLRPEQQTRVRAGIKNRESRKSRAADDMLEARIDGMLLAFAADPDQLLARGDDWPRELPLAWVKARIPR